MRGKGFKISRTYIMHKTHGSKNQLKRHPKFRNQTLNPGKFKTTTACCDVTFFFYFFFIFTNKMYSISKFRSDGSVEAVPSSWVDVKKFDVLLATRSYRKLDKIT